MSEHNHLEDQTLQQVHVLLQLTLCVVMQDTSSLELQH